MRIKDIARILVLLLFLCGIVIFIVFLVTVAMYESFLLAAVCIVAVIFVIMAGRFLNKTSE